MYGALLIKTEITLYDILREFILEIINTLQDIGLLNKTASQDTVLTPFLV